MARSNPTSSETRTEMTARIRRGDAETLGAVAREHREGLVRYAMRSGLSADRAEDTVQETFATFLEVAPRYEGRSSVRTFLFGILRRKLAEGRRRRTRTEPLVHEAPAEEAATPDAAVDAAASVPPCLEGVPTQQRRAFVLREVEERPAEEVTRALGISSANLRVLVHRARRRLQACVRGA